MPSSLKTRLSLLEVKTIQKVSQFTQFKALRNTCLTLKQADIYMVVVITQTMKINKYRKLSISMK